jgi:hypothetical protein
MLGAKFPNYSLNNAVSPNAIPFTATSRLLPSITITIGNADLTFLLGHQMIG